MTVGYEGILGSVCSLLFLVRQSLEQRDFWCLRSFCSGLYFVLLKGGYDRIDRSIYSELILVLQTFRCVGVLGYFSY